MPANLTPDYERAEAKYREAADDEQRLEALREMYSVMPKHKGTEKLQAELKRKMSHLRKAVSRAPRKQQDVFHVPKAGAGQVVLVGTPNVGKSALVLKATGAHVKVAEYPFTTVVPMPGMAQFEDTQIELVDTPPLTAEHVTPGLMGTIRHGDIIGIVIDAAGAPLDDAQTVLGIFESREMTVSTRPVQDLDPSDPGQACALLIANKIDIAPAPPRPEGQAISATTGEGVAALVDLLADKADAALAAGEPAVITRARHRAELDAAAEALHRYQGVRGRPELKAEELRIAARHLGRLTGRIDVEEVLGAIFSEFCIGK